MPSDLLWGVLLAGINIIGSNLHTPYSKITDQLSCISRAIGK